MKKRRRFCFYASALMGLCALWVVYVFGTVYVTQSMYPVQSLEKNKTSKVDFYKKPPKNWSNLKHVARVARYAILVSEDGRFYEHSGFDFFELKRAFQKNLKSKSYSRGASTISQQVAKNLYLTKEKSILRKIKEVFYTLALEVFLTKDEIFERYLNVAEWGHGLFGIKAASYHYFKKSPAELNAKEGAFLAVLLPSPVKRSSSFYQKQLSFRTERQIKSILHRMNKAGYLSYTEAVYLEHFPLPFEIVEQEPEVESPIEEKIEIHEE